jgi:endoribonuclease Dicer
VSVVLAESIPLVFQQACVIERQTGLKVGTYCGETAIFNWEAELANNDVLVATAGLFLKLLDEKTLSLEQCSLLVFDEAHHCVKNHPFNMIMKTHYFTLEPSARPPVLGMTASPACGESFEQTCELIMKLGCNLHCQVMAPSETEAKAALQSAVTIPDLVYVPVDINEKYKDFGTIFETYLEQLYALLTKDFKLLKGLFKATPEQLRGMAFCCDEIEVCLQADVTPEQRFILDHMLMLCEKREDMAELGSCAGISAMKQVFGKLCDDWASLPQAMSLAANALKAMISESELYSKVKDGQFEELEVAKLPRTKALMDYLLGHCMPDADGEKRIIIFVKTRRAAKMICGLIRDESHFDGKLKPDVVVGHGTGGDGMNHREQERVCARFRNGEVNVLVATSVVEEGLDVSTCNAVIRYSSTSTVTAFIQSRGRARQKDSKYVILCDGTAEDAKRNVEVLRLKEQDMDMAVQMAMSGVCMYSHNVIVPDSSTNAVSTGTTN